MDETDADMDISSTNCTLDRNAEFSCLEMLHLSRTICEEEQTLEQSHINASMSVEESVVLGETTEVSAVLSESLELNVLEESAYFQQPLAEVGRRLWPSSAEAQNYTKGCLWSPDGTCLLMPVHLDGMHVIELPSDLYSMSTEDLAKLNQSSILELPTAVHVKEGGTVYDFTWYPFMNSSKPETCCWIATRQHEPIHMWDAFSGELRCTYRGYDDVDEVEAAISLAFSNDGERIIGGYKKSIRVFDTNVPGRDSTSIKVKQAVSCIAFTDESPDSVTVGSWNGFINHYDLRAGHLGSLFTLGGHSGGITWLRYVESGNNCMLYSGARKDNKILQYDMRNYQKPLREFERTVKTNQRIYFDFSPQRHWLASGNTSGVLSVWDLHEKSEALQFPLHKDCLNGVSFHPMLPLLATTSGQYHFVEPDGQEAPEIVRAAAEVPPKEIINYENALLLLWWK